jgi:hypothetical protein
VRRFVPWFNFILYGGLALLALGAATWVSCYEQPIGAYIAAWATAAGFLGVFVVIFFKWFSKRPDYIVHGAAVWTAGIRYLYKQHMDDALEFYITRLPQLLEEANLEKYEGKYGKVTSSKLACMLVGARVEWTDRAISMATRFWTIRDANGLQQGRDVMVRWMGGIAGSALFHELHHMVDELILERGPDYAHANKAWWDLVPLLKKGFEV